jgi:hypothetical protein
MSFKTSYVSKLQGGSMREWVMEMAVKAYTFTLPFYSLALAITVFVLLPLAVWRKTRSTASIGLLVASYIFGVTTWLLGAAVTFGAFGWFGLIVGLLVFGISVVPLAIIGAIFKQHDGGLALVLFVMVLVTLASRLGGAYAASKAER